MSKAIFDKDYKVSGEFDPGDKWWWRFESIEESSSRIEVSSQNGTIIARGSFRDDPSGEGIVGRLDEVVFKDTSGDKIATIENIDGRIDEISQILYDADDWPDQDEAWAISDILLADLKRIDLSDRSDRTDKEWLDGFETVKVYAGNGNDFVYGEGGKDKLFGGNGDDTLKGADNKDTLTGNSGADMLQGGSGNDTLKGGSGNDTLQGGNGKDRLIGDSGKDKLSGGGGDDVFYFAKGAGTKDRITDFADGDDLIKIGKGASEFGDLTLKRAGDDVKVKFADVVFYVEDTAKSDLSEADFLF